MATSTLESAYQWCEALAQSHYENFPIASFFLPKRLRRPIKVIYAFARSADDISDEGQAFKTERLEKLNAYWQELDTIEQGQSPTQPLFWALKEVIQTHSLPISLFFDLLRAFQQDVMTTDYENIEAILQYCQYSANPIGRLILHLVQQATPENCHYSDAICTALQLINFLQDLDSDLQLRQRCYLPQDEMKQLNVSRADLLSRRNTPSIQQLIEQQRVQAKHLLETGKPLARRVPGLLGFELRLVVSGGEQILKALLKRSNPYERPVLKAWHWPKLLFNTLVFS